MDGRIAYLKRLFLNDLSHEWNIKEMAEKVDLSASHLQKLFKSNLGVSPYSYLQGLRLEHARELLELTFLQIKQIGNQTGLTNESHFTRDFQKKFGMTPSKYRSHCWELEQSKPLNGQQ